MQNALPPRAALAALAFLALAAAPGTAPAQTAERFYDAQGRYAGRADTSRGVTRFYDAQGRYSGQARASGRTTPVAPPRPRPPQQQGR